MQRIKTLELENFKYFYGKHVISFDRKNILIFGENGSGKSSIYWSLYTFLQTPLKPDNARAQKYFKPLHDENLINRFAANTANSGIKIVFEEDDGMLTTKELSSVRVSNRTDTLIIKMLNASDFINYKLLARLYDVPNKDEIDLFLLFEREIFVYRI